MSKVIEFPSQNRECETPNYAGHVLMLDLSKARRWQTFGFLVTVRGRTAVVPDNAFMSQIHEALKAGILIDITEHPELFVPEKSIADVTESDTGKKAYSGTRQFFRDLGVEDDDPKAPGNEIVCYSTENQEEQQRIEAELAKIPVVAAAPVTPEQARQRARRTLIELPPGMDDPDKYTLPLLS